VISLLMRRAVDAGSSRLFAFAVAGIGLGLTVAVFVIYAQLTASHFLGDAYVYLGAGERLNAGHPLYSLTTGDRPIPIQPPFWTAPLVSPPLIAVLWRPLAALPNDAGVLVWWIASLLALGGSIFYIVRREPLLAGLAMVALSVPIAMEAGLGNVNALLLAGSVAAWHWRERPWAGVIIGVMIAVKLWPAVLGLWLIALRGVGALVPMAVALAACALVSLAGAGWDNHVAYLTVGQGVHPSAFSLTWQLGIPWLWLATFLVGVILVVATRGKPSWSYRIAVVTMVLGTPVANPNSYAQLLAILAPATLPRPSPDPDEPVAQSLSTQ
jgi:hypothetical protein